MLARDSWRRATASESRVTSSASHGSSELALFYLSDEKFFEEVTVISSASREDGVATVSFILPTRHDYKLWTVHIKQTSGVS